MFPNQNIENAEAPIVMDFISNEKGEKKHTSLQQQIYDAHLNAKPTDFHTRTVTWNSNSSSQMYQNSRNLRNPNKLWNYALWTFVTKLEYLQIHTHTLFNLSKDVKAKNNTVFSWITKTNLKK